MIFSGLMDHYYDGCIGFLPTPDRLNSFNFTEPYTPNFHAALFWKEGSEGDHHDVTGKKVGEYYKKGDIPFWGYFCPYLYALNSFIH